jgi:hypothetical protein
MTVRKFFFMAVICMAAIAFTGCKKKQADACTDPNCEDEACAVPGQKAAVETKRELEVQSICPVMGAPINQELFVDKGDLRIYVSEESAKAELTANFDKYVEELKGMGQKPETIQKQ